MPEGHQYPIAPTPTETVPAKKSWVHMHPYLAAAVAAGTLIVIVAGVVTQRSGVAGSNAANNWVGAGSIFSGGKRSTTPLAGITAEDIFRQKAPDVALPYIPLPTHTDGTTENYGYGDLDQLLSLLSTPPSGGTTGIDVSAAFSFIPQGLISPMSAPKMTAQQEVLYSYGNNLGNVIQSYDSFHQNSIQTMKDQAEDRGNAQKTAALKQLGFDMAVLGREILDMQDIPASMKAANDALGNSYRLAGTNMTKISEASGDKAYIDAITTYNASIEALTKRYLVIVNLFSANNVTFSSSDPGSVFMFSSSPSF